jgi:DNA repair exonuclease SbcCD ATPase subunit
MKTYSSEIKQCRLKVDNLLAERRVQKKAVRGWKKRLKEEEAKLKELEKLQVLFQTAVKILYSTLSTRLGDIVTEGLNIVFPETGYVFKIEFVEKRNTVEANIYLEDSDGYSYHPVKDVGGGIADFVSLLLRIAYIMLSKHDNILIADEPGKFIDRERISDAACFLHKILKELDFQMVMMTHIPEFTEKAGKVYKVTKKGKTSKVKELTL